MNKRILLSSMSIFASLALVTGATFAFFSDSGTSTNNVFGAGDLVLQLDDVDEGFVDDTVTESLGVTDLAPGDSTEGFISLHNEGSVAAAEVVFGAGLTSPDVTEDLAGVLDLEVKTGTDNTVCTDEGATDHTSDINTAIGGIDGLQLSDLIAADYDSLPGLAADGDLGDTYYVCLTLTLQEDAGDAFQGASDTVDFGFTANQDVTQGPSAL